MQILPTQEEVNAWGLPGVLDFFETNRNEQNQLYVSERLFLEKLLREGVSILDVGCAMGGFSEIIGSYVKNFEYTGIDTNFQMIERAKEKNPQHTFFHTPSLDFSPLQNRHYDIVLCLGVLHLTVSWKTVLNLCWQHTKNYFLFDLRESCEPTVDCRPDLSFFKMDFNANLNDKAHTESILPYNVINSGDSLAVISEICQGLKCLASFGYLRQPSSSAVCPIERVLMRTYLAGKCSNEFF